MSLYETVTICATMVTSGHTHTEIDIQHLSAYTKSSASWAKTETSASIRNLKTFLCIWRGGPETFFDLVVCVELIQRLYTVEWAPTRKAHGARRSLSRYWLRCTDRQPAVRVDRLRQSDVCHLYASVHCIYNEAQCCWWSTAVVERRRCANTETLYCARYLWFGTFITAVCV